ncbi:hypothetical protein [Nocardia jejuensis]|uniref:hypothetical protein n=1 Tax=Nocardia jejuensis TaxID=328049 RepID=UPI00083769D5|nr:hypothetical protein [Nocardia jejuensis]
MALMRTRRYPSSAGSFVTGAEETSGVVAQRGAAAAARAPGMDIRIRELPGGHSWQVWSAGLRTELE